MNGRLPARREFTRSFAGGRGRGGTLIPDEGLPGLDATNIRNTAVTRLGTLPRINLPEGPGRHGIPANEEGIEMVQEAANRRGGDSAIAALPRMEQSFATTQFAHQQHLQGAIEQPPPQIGGAPVADQAPPPVENEAADVDNIIPEFE